MGKTLYLECNTGISGDMTVAALLDLGADYEALCRVLSTIPVSGFETRVSRVKKEGLDCCDFAVLLEEECENHDHDMEYLFGHEKGQEQGHGPEDDHEHSHEHNHARTHDQTVDTEHSHAQDHSHSHEHTGDHSHSHEHAEGLSHSHTGESVHSHTHTHDHSHTHVHRGMAEIRQILEKTEMTDRARQTALHIFTILGEAEAKAHGETLESVHFHEVGAVDSIVDIISAAVCLDLLDIEKAVIPYLCEGTGSVRAAHGILPVPVPATLNIVSAYRIPMKILPEKGERVTPTGAAITAAIRSREEEAARLLQDGIVIEKVGLGAGKRSYERAGILRAMLVEPAALTAGSSLQTGR